MSTDYIKYPLNYTGGKFKLLQQILPLFPFNINNFLDMFAGGCNVGINANANRIICNDSNKMLINMLKWMEVTDSKELIRQMDLLIEYIN